MKLLLLKKQKNLKQKLRNKLIEYLEKKNFEFSTAPGIYPNTLLLEPWRWYR